MKVPSLSSTSFYLRNAIASSYQRLNSLESLIDLKKWRSLTENGGKSLSSESVKQTMDNEKSQTLNSNHEQNCNNIFETAMFEWIGIDEKSKVNEESKSVAEATSPSVIKKSHAPTITKSAIENRTRQLVGSLTSVKTPMSGTLRIQELCKHLIQYPEASDHAVKEGAVSLLLRLREWSKDKIVAMNSREALSLLGYSDPPKGRGIRILSIDGGGTRGIMVIEMLRYIEQLTGKPIHKLFDLMCGVSTGAIITMLMGPLQTPVNECEEFYRRFSSHLFKSDFLRGAGRLLWSHAYYDTAVWEKVLKEIYGETHLIETAQHSEIPHVLTISAVMNMPSIQAFLFRNYAAPNRAQSQYEGSCSHKIWESVRASAAAPGYFEEFRLGPYVHLDGGILINNPTAVAIHEAKMLWPNEDIQCVLSLGSGRYIPPANITPQNEPPVSLTSLKTKIFRLIDSATDTEMVHRLMQDLLPRGTYYRLNPTLSETSTLDENRPEKLEQMKIDAQMYMRKNEYKVKSAIKEITRNRSNTQLLSDWIRLQYSLRTS